MAPPTFSDLGKDAKDMFDKDFKMGILNFEVKSKTHSKTDLKINGTHLVKDGVFSTFLEGKSKLACGITSKVKLDSKRTVLHELEINERIVKGLKTVLAGQCKMDAGTNTVDVKNNHKGPNHNANMDMSFTGLVCPSTQVNMVLGGVFMDMPLVAGANAFLEPHQVKPSKWAVAVGYRASDIQVHTQLNEKKDVDFSLFHASNLGDMAFKINWNGSSRQATYGVGYHTMLTPTVGMKTKVDSQLRLGLSYIFHLTQGVKLSVCGLMDGKNLQAGTHDLGVNLEMDIQ